MADGFLGRFVNKLKECCTNTKDFKEFVTGRKELLSYLDEFFIVSYSKYALQRGLVGDSVKVIYIYDFDEYGNRRLTEKVYSKERVYALREIHKIPGYDKTQEQEEGLPIYGKTSLMEVEYS